MDELNPQAKDVATAFLVHLYEERYRLQALSEMICKTIAVYERVGDIPPAEPKPDSPSIQRPMASAPARHRITKIPDVRDATPQITVITTPIPETNPPADATQSPAPVAATPEVQINLAPPVGIQIVAPAPPKPKPRPKPAPFVPPVLTTPPAARSVVGALAAAGGQPVTANAETILRWGEARGIITGKLDLPQINAKRRQLQLPPFELETPRPR